MPNSNDAYRRFEGGLMRHVNAMAACPNCRYLEVAPLKFLLPKNRQRLMDLFAGTGLVTRTIANYFNDVMLVDPHVPPFEVIGPEMLWYQTNALFSEGIQSLPEADLAVCLAGFHHVLGPESGEALESHRQRRLEVLRLWLSKLQAGGRLVIADVPSEGTKYGWVVRESDENFTQPQHNKMKLYFQADGSALASLLDCSCLDEYLTDNMRVVRKFGLVEPEPASFFDQVVDKFSPHGHSAYFNSPQELVDLMHEAGFNNINCFVVPTPWLFATKTQALWFVHELLSIGQPCDTSNDLSSHERDLIEKGVADHLGLRQLPNKFWALSWKLMYVVGDRL